jgi:hypothetical protein
MANIIGHVLLEVLGIREDVRGLHRASLLRAEDAGYCEASGEPIDVAVEANPVSFWELLNPIATLVDRYVAVAAKDD